MRAVVAFCRKATALNVPFCLVASSPGDPIFQTQYSGSVVLTRQTNDLCIADMQNWFHEILVSKSLDRLMVLPTSEFLNRFLLDHKAELEDAGHSVPLVDKQLYNRISDKQSFVKICADHGLVVPQEFIDQPAKLPFVAKPKRYAAVKTGRQLKPWLISSESDLQKFQAVESPGEFFFQEFVVGKSVYLLYFVSQDDKHVVYSQENLIQQSNGGSIVVATQSSEHSEPIAQQYLDMFKSLGYSGPVMVELKVTEDNHVMIEANPRFWGPLQFVVDSGVPIIESFLSANGFSLPTNAVSPLPASHGNDVRYFWSGGMSKSAQPFVFHNYNANRFVDDFPDLKRHDVFLRDDTINLYLSEFRDK
ncbi:carbamoyl phosphate synthase-like protein [Rubripirellula tenax]|uniref:Carbamoyl phosphate synthase-like protein n=2 Tax=Rubripirellula tenax TaxID=2528015 RepID=A0A5C6EIQ7_9BACT|nr:carbamoyl phosphate synthase-like protein [Rubripirellula tenax]